MLSYPTPIVATYFNTLESESPCHLHLWRERKTGSSVAGGFFSFLALQAPLSPPISNTFPAKSLIHICTKGTLLP